jgi:hypothetical protein
LCVISQKVLDTQTKLWLKSEYDPLEDAGLKKSYAEMKTQIISKNFPKLYENQVKFLSRETQGL